MRSLMTEREYVAMILRDDYLLGHTTQKWTLNKIGEHFGIRKERARQIYIKAKHKQITAYVARIRERTGEPIPWYDLENELSSRVKVSQYLEQKYWEVLHD